MSAAGAPLPCLLVALSGPTSSGKTTIASALTSIFEPSHHTLRLIHADDFYKTDSAIPIHPGTGLQDWDCAEALDLPRFRQTLLDVKDGADVPADLVKQGGWVPDGVHASDSAFHGENDGGNGLNEAWVAELKKRVPGLTTVGRTRLVIVEGFLLFGESVREELGALFDLKLLLRSTRELAQERRKIRNGYVTLEGFWQDPEGYFEDVVWPNFVEDHGYLFEDGNVEGAVRNGQAGKTDNIMVGPIGDVGLQRNCEWAVTCIGRALERLTGKKEGEAIRNSE